MRDLLLDRPIHDLDFVVARGAFKLAQDVAARFGGTLVPLDVERGIARVGWSRDAVPDGDALWKGALDFADFQASTLEDDLGSRDLTVNAMAIDVAALCDATSAEPQRGGVESLLRDPVDGCADLCAGLVRCPRVTVLDEDPLRVLRVVRFMCALGFEVEASTLAALRGRVARLSAVAGERVRDEFFKILGSNRAADGCVLLDAVGALAVLFPELESLRGLVQGGFHHVDAFEHSMLTLRAIDQDAIPTGCRGLPDPSALFTWLDAESGGTRRTRLQSLRLAALLHDVGKSLTRHLSSDGCGVSYEGHAEAGVALAESVCERLRLSVRERTLIAGAVRHHLVPLEMPPGTLAPRTMRRYFAEVGEGGVETLLLALADSAAARGPKNTPAARRALEERVRALLTWRFGKAVAGCVPLVDGRTVCRVMQCRPGPVVGEWLDRLADEQADGTVTTRDEAVAWLELQREKAD